MKRKNLINLLALCLLCVCFVGNVHAQKGSVTVQQDARIPQLLDLKKSLEKENKLTDGFTIQLYYGNLNKANTMLRDYKNKYTKWPASIEYETPNYKVWVGNFTSRLEADRALIEVQKNFASAFILRPGKNKKEE